MNKIPNPFQVLLDEISSIQSKIDELKKSLSQSTKIPPEEVFLTQKEAAKLLGISTVTLWSWNKKHIIKSYKIGTLNRYKKSEILASPKLIKH
jgi:excisionase family DNA binding protein